MADTKTYLKVPYRGGTLRMTPFNGGHLTALKMAEQFKSETRKVNVVLRILHGMLGEDAYEGLTNDFVDGSVEVSDLFTLLNDAVKATEAYHQAKKATGAEPEPEPEDNGLDSDHGRE